MHCLVLRHALATVAVLSDWILLVGEQMSILKIVGFGFLPLSGEQRRRRRAEEKARRIVEILDGYGMLDAEPHSGEIPRSQEN